MPRFRFTNVGVLWAALLLLGGCLASLPQATSPDDGLGLSSRAADTEAAASGSANKVASCVESALEPRRALAGDAWNLGGPKPHLVAHYLPWFETATPVAPGAGPWAHWRWRGGSADHDPERRLLDGRRDIASAHYPLIGPYATADRAVLAYHFSTLRAVGVQALVVLWYGPGSPTDAVLPAIFEEADRAGLRVGLCYEEKINWPDYRQPADRTTLTTTAAADLTYWLDNYAGHPAQLTRGGVPVMFQFNYWGADRLGPRTLLPSEWREIAAAVGRPYVYVRQNLDAGFHPLLPGAYGWWMAAAAERREFTRRASEAVAEGRLAFFMTMVAPGFDDIGVDGWGGGRRHSPREGSDTLRATFADALLGGPELVQLVTFNDFNEGTEFEPTVEHGFSVLDALALWWAESQGRGAPDLADNRAPLRAYLEALPPAARAEVPAAAWREAGLPPPHP